MRYLYNKKIKTEVSPFFTGFIFFPFFLKIDTKSLKLTMLQFSKKKKTRLKKNVLRQWFLNGGL